MNKEDAPTCAPCGVKKHPWSLNSWKCPQCGAVGVSSETQMEALTRRVEHLERSIVQLALKSKRAG